MYFTEFFLACEFKTKWNSFETHWFFRLRELGFNERYKNSSSLFMDTAIIFFDIWFY